MPQSKGIVSYVGPTEQVKENLTRRVFAVSVIQHNPETGEAWEHKEAYQLMNGNTALADNVRVGDTVIVYFAIRSNETVKEGRSMWFTNLNAVKIDVNNQASTPVAPTTQGHNDDLPF